MAIAAEFLKVTVRVLACGLMLTSVAAKADVVALKTQRQMLEYYAAVTGVNAHDPQVATVYEGVRSRLPATGKADEMGSPMVLAVTELSAIFCQKMIDSDAAIDDVSRRHAHRQVGFDQTPSGLTDDVRRSVVDEYAALFWQRAATQTESDALLATFETSIRTAPSTSAETKRVLKAVCIAAGSSVASLVF